jgi:hypothetical protein
MAYPRPPAAVLALCALGLSASPLSAQEFSPLSSFATGSAMATSQAAAMGDVFRDVYGPGSHSPAGRGVPSRGGVPAMRPGGAMAGGPGALPPSAALPRLTYQPTKALADQAMTDYVGRLRKANPQAADAMVRAFADQNVGRIYSGIVAPFGLKDRNVADSFTAYTVLGWMIVNGAGDPPRSGVLSARDQFASRLAADPRFAGHAGSLGEELKISFVTLHAGWQSARKEGSERQYAEGVARMFAKQGMDLRSFQLTANGFAQP